MRFNLKVSRFDPSKEESPHLETYEYEAEGQLNVIQAIRRVFQTVDGTLSFRDTDCHRGVCGLCSMMIDGNRRLACMCIAEDGMTVAPPPNRKVIKDLLFELD